MNNKAILFDMDGLLIDSMIHWIDLDNQMFEENNMELTPEMIIYFTGKSMRQNMQYLKEKFNLEKSVEELMVEKFKLTDDIYNAKSMPMPGVQKLLENLYNSDFKSAIASGSSLERINKIVDRFAWHNYFDKLVSVEDVAHRGKPEPDVYLHAAKEIAVRPEDCIVFEDAENGVVSAKRAGMKCIAVIDERWSFGDFSQADLVVDSLDDSRVYSFLGL